MSHLVCPLCGKNAPLSTLNPEALDLDIKVVSFRGLGYGRGFAKAEEHSILGDDEYSPALANRSLQLCSMFLKAGVLKEGDLKKILNISSINIDLSNALPNQNKESQHTIFYLENQLKIVNEEYEMKDEVDYILREGAEFTNSGCIVANSEGWYLKLNKEEPRLELYLQLLLRELPVNLKNLLLSRIINEEDPLWFKIIYEDASRRKSLLDLLLDQDRVEIIRKKDNDGKIHEMRIETAPLFNRDDNRIHLESLIEIVSDIKSVINDPSNEEKFRKVLRGF